MSNDDRGKLKTLERDLKSVVFGQDKALDVLASAVKMARSGLGRGDKPIGSFLFSGPTGVGKTEAAKQLAYIMGIDLIRFDMSEYMERHAVSRLIGAPPGYVGFDQGGLLTEAVTKKPHCVLLLDEIEKAHPDIFNVLLQVMDHGTLTDNNGRKADFRNVIIVMTTNAGAEALNKTVMGFTNKHDVGDELADIKRLFTPEFRNRLDATVSFKALDENVILRVVDKFLLQLETQLAEKKVDVTFTDKLRKHLAKKGFDPADGRAPDAAADSGHDSPRAGRRVAVWSPDRGRTPDRRPGRQGRGRCSTSPRCPRKRARPSRKRRRSVESGLKRWRIASIRWRFKPRSDLPSRLAERSSMTCVAGSARTRHRRQTRAMGCGTAHRGSRVCPTRRWRPSFAGLQCASWFMAAVASPV